MADSIVLPRHKFFKNIAGQRFGRWLVVSYAGRFGSKKVSYWNCVCDCGTEKNVRATTLMQGHTNSCGCGNREAARQRCTRHGQSTIPEYRVWAAMKDRCSNSNNEEFINYGGRGIKVSERWQSFENFIADMGRRPSKNHEIDRIDNNGSYSIENCRWATKNVQSRNKRTTVLLTYQGKTQCITDWAKELGISPATISFRIRKGKSVAEILTR